MSKVYFHRKAFSFLKALKNNNNREWFREHKSEYETLIRAPAFNFINDIGNDLNFISPHFLAIANKTGGSLMRVHRDVRFAKDKTPYKPISVFIFVMKEGKMFMPPVFM